MTVMLWLWQNFVDEISNLLISENITFNQYDLYRSGFLKKDPNHSPNSHQKIWRTYGLRTDALLGVISDILWVSANPVDVKNYLQQGNRPQAACSSNFLMWVWGMISFHSSKKSPVISLELAFLSTEME